LPEKTQVGGALLPVSVAPDTLLAKEGAGGEGLRVVTAEEVARFVVLTWTSPTRSSGNRLLNPSPQIAVATGSLPTSTIDPGGNAMVIRVPAQGASQYRSMNHVRYDATAASRGAAATLQAETAMTGCWAYTGHPFLLIDGAGNWAAAWSRDAGSRTTLGLYRSHCSVTSAQWGTITR